MKTRLEITATGIIQTPGCSKLVSFLDVVRGNDRQNICNGTQVYCERMRNAIYRGQVPEWQHVTQELHRPKQRTA